MAGYNKNVLNMNIIIAIMWITISIFAIDMRTFSISGISSFFNYICCKLIATVMIVFFVRLIIYFVTTYDTNNILKKSLLLSLPILLLFICTIFYFLTLSPRWYTVTTGDMGLIYDCAKKLNCYYDFHFLTSWFYIISLMIIPHPTFIIVFKNIAWIAVATYMFYQIQIFFGNYNISKRFRIILIALTYFVFTFLPVLLLSTNCHRIYCYMPFIILVYLKMYELYLTKRELSICQFFMLALGVACVAQWRPEGIAILFMWGVLLVLYSSYHKKSLKEKVMIAIIVILANVVVFVPQNLETFAGRTNYADVRLHPLYSYRITTMIYENSIDEKKYLDELIAINKVISIEAIKKLNSDLGYETYANGYIRWKEGYIGVTDNYSMDNYRKYVRGELASIEETGFGSKEYESYASACKKIFMSEPLSYLKSCINTFMYVEDKGYTEGSGDGYVPKVIIKIYYSLILAAIINTVILVLAIVKKSWFSLIMAISLYLQAGMVFTLSPGAYYKYYMPTCICVYLNVIIILVDLLGKRKTINE